MKKFWKWLSQRKFMQDTAPVEPQRTCEQQLALAVLRFAEEHNLNAPGHFYESRVSGHNVKTGADVAVHYEVWPCSEPDVCFDTSILTEGATIQ